MYFTTIFSSHLATLEYKRQSIYLSDAVFNIHFTILLGPSASLDKYNEGFGQQINNSHILSILTFLFTTCRLSVPSSIPQWQTL